MPAHSAKQYKFMKMMSHSPEKKYTKGVGPSQKVAKEMISKTSKSDRSNYSKKG